MIDRFIATIEHIIEQYGTLGIFFASFIEEIIAPIPSGLVMMTSGYAFLSGSPITVSNIIYLFFNVAIVLSLGLTLGSILVYVLAYKYGEPVIKRFGKYFFISWKDVEKVSKNFARGYKDEWVLLALRVIPVIPSIAINTVAGLIRIRPTHYIVATLLGTTIRAFAMSFAGWQLGNVYKKYAIEIDRFENYVLYTILALILGFIAWKKYQNKSSVI